MPGTGSGKARGTADSAEADPCKEECVQFAPEYEGESMCLCGHKEAAHQRHLPSAAAGAFSSPSLIADLQVCCKLTNDLVEPPLLMTDCQLFLASGRRDCHFELLLSGHDVAKLGCTPVGETLSEMVPFHQTPMILQRFSPLILHIPLVDMHTGAKTTKSEVLTPYAKLDDWHAAIDAIPEERQLVQRGLRKLPHTDGTNAFALSADASDAAALEKSPPHKELYEYTMKIAPIQQWTGPAEGVALLGFLGMLKLNATVRLDALELHYRGVNAPLELMGSIELAE